MFLVEHILILYYSYICCSYILQSVLFFLAKITIFLMQGVDVDINKTGHFIFLISSCSQSVPLSV